MEAIVASAEAILVLLGISAIGFFVIARKIVPADALKSLSTMAIEVSMPLYIFANLIDKFDPNSASDWWQLPLWWIFFALLTLGMALLSGLIFPTHIRKEATASLYLYNPIFVPLSILIGVYGNDSPYIADLFLFTMFTATFYFNFYTFFFRKEGEHLFPGKLALDRKKLFNPLIEITVFALLLVLSGFSTYVPGVVLSIARYVGSLCFTLVMLILGGYVYLDMKNSGKIRWGAVIKFIAVKNVVFPLLMLFILYVIRPAYNVALLLVISAAAPPLSTTPILVGRQNGNTQITNQFLVASFLFSIASIPLMIMLLNYILV